MQNDSLVYVSVEGTLKQVLHWNKVWDDMCDIDSESANQDILTSYFSGTNFKRLYGQLQNEIEASFYPVVIQLYYDDFETVNPIGTKTGLHKLGGFYFNILNCGRKHNSKLDNIFMVALVYKQDIIRYGMTRVLKPFIDEMKKLESGIDVVREDGSTRHVVCLLGNIVADNLGLHSILGYMESFQHSYSCDLCLGTAESFQSVFKESNLVLRDRKQYEIHCDRLEKQQGSKGHVFGLKFASNLSQLKYYHPSENDTCDLMHDILEGVAPYETNLLLRDALLKRKLLSIEALNAALASFEYGSIMSSSKPSEISLVKLQSSTSLGQHSHQMLVLLYVLPLIVGKYMTVDNLNWKLFLLLLEILDLLLAPMVSVGQLSFLSELIADHHTLFCELYPDERLKYKHHRMVHYPTVMLRNGPLSHMWVMRFEAKHGYFKRLAHITCNFRNVCKSLARRNQMRQAAIWLKPSHFESAVHVGTGSETVVIAHKEFVSLFPKSTDTLRDAFLANSVTVYGTRYEPGYTVIMDVDSEGYPVLGYIVKILVCEGLVSFAVQKWIIDRFDGMTRSYMCLLSHSKVACHQRSLFDFHLLFAHQCLDEACGYYHVRLRHMLCSDC